VKEAHKVLNLVTDGRPSPGMRALLIVVEQFIAEFFGRREFHLAPTVVEFTPCRFREELEAILATNALRDSRRGKVPLFLLRASTSLE
jgi:hypothetical protein